MAHDESRLRVHSPPFRPTLIYDGECRFCLCQVKRQQQRTGEAVDFLASKAPEVQRRFPEIPTDRYERSLQFVTTDGLDYSGAHGAIKARAITGSGT